MSIHPSIFIMCCLGLVVSTYTMEQQATPAGGPLIIWNNTEHEIGVYFRYEVEENVLEGPLKFDSGQTQPVHPLLHDKLISVWQIPVTIWYKKRLEEMVYDTQIKKMGDWEIKENDEGALILQEKKENSPSK